MNEKHLKRAAERVMDAFKESEVVNVIVQDNRMYITLKSGKNFELSSDDISYQIDMSAKLQVKASEFLDWMFEGSHDDMAFGRATSDMLKSQGRINITIKDVFNTASYIPTRIMHDYPFPMDGLEYDPSEVELIDDITK